MVLLLLSLDILPIFQVNFIFVFFGLRGLMGLVGGGVGESEFC